MACDKCGARTIEIIKPGEPCPLCEAREKVKDQALQIVKLRELISDIVLLNRKVNEGAFSFEEIENRYRNMRRRIKETLALNTEDAEKILTEMKAESYIEGKWDMAVWLSTKVGASQPVREIIGKAREEAARARSEGKS